jgi:Skp family chaperone for outer membrane proteins
MNNFLRRIAPITLVLFVFSGTAWAQTRVATVDMRKLFDKYWKTETAQKALRERGGDLAKESTTLRENWKKDSEEYKKMLADANEQAISTEERDKRKQAAEAKLRDIRKSEEDIALFERQAKTQLEEQNRRMRENILNEIRTVVSARAKSAGYTLVLDTAADSANSTPVILYDNGDNDLTDAVLTQLNAGAPVDTKKPDAGKTGKTTK